jgi:hypothetical protein
MAAALCALGATAGCEYHWDLGPPVAPCPSWEPTRCQNTGCTDLQSTVRACGSCDVDCGLGTCSAGACTCTGGNATCSGPGRRCVDLTTDAQNCGACRQACRPYESCAAGTCTCVAPRLACADGCIDPETDSRHCGGCGNTCSAGQACSLGRCCPSGQVGCGAGSQCCPGECCSGTCATAHGNGPAAAGFGQPWYDCGPLQGPGSYTREGAVRAGAAWRRGTGPTDASGCDASCLYYIDSSLPVRSCAVWCYTGSKYVGQVFGPSPAVETTSGYSCTSCGPPAGTWN